MVPPQPLALCIGASAGGVEALLAPVPERLTQELAIDFGNLDMSHPDRIADVSTLTCPDWGGSLWEVLTMAVSCGTGDAAQAAAMQARADRLWRQADDLELLLEEEISNGEARQRRIIVCS